MEKVMAVLFFTLLGAALGSFFNVVASRSVSGRSWWGKERSRCPSCGHRLAWTDLIPLLSWIVLKGRCRYCRKPISVRYFAVEILGAVIGGSLAARWGLTFPLVFALPAAFGLLLNALTDLEEGYVFDIFPLLMGVCGMLLRLFGGRDAMIDGVLGALAGFSVIAVIILASRGGMGWGDATLMAGTGSLLGWKFTLLTLYLGFMVGGVIVLILLAAKKVKRKDAIPLVPFLALGGVLTLLA
ncbi:MAG: prepilin peptidase, partial [Synergistaceae bacterium]|nr:prepilin peptidase [Synergistaceae bacterium]